MYFYVEEKRFDDKMPLLSSLYIGCLEITDGVLTYNDCEFGLCVPYKPYGWTDTDGKYYVRGCGHC
jgi:hypothetical protein